MTFQLAKNSPLSAIDTVQFNMMKICVRSHVYTFHNFLQSGAKKQKVKRPVDKMRKYMKVRETQHTAQENGQDQNEWEREREERAQAGFPRKAAKAGRLAAALLSSCVWKAGKIFCDPETSGSSRKFRLTIYNYFTSEATAWQDKAENARKTVALLAVASSPTVWSVSSVVYLWHDQI